MQYNTRKRNVCFVENNSQLRNLIENNWVRRDPTKKVLPTELSRGEYPSPRIARSIQDDVATARSQAFTELGLAPSTYRD